MAHLLEDLKGTVLATGVGSLPSSEPREAVDFVFDVFLSHIPFWPQLPKTSFYEHMIVQFTEKFPGIRIDEAQRSVWVQTQGEEFVGALEESLRQYEEGEVGYFAISESRARGLYLLSQRLMDTNWQSWVKAQIIGPLSLGLSLLDENKRPILYHPELSEFLPLFLSLKASWMIRRIKTHQRTKIIMFVDEPYLVAVGTSSCSLPAQTVIEKINEVVRAIHDQGCLAGLHCCGNTDWELVMSTDIDILNFDAYSCLDKLSLYEKPLASFLKKGKVLALGVVPNNQEVLQDNIEDFLLDILKRHRGFFANGALITPSCGCAGLTQDLSDKAHRLCVRLAERLKGEI